MEAVIKTDAPPPGLLMPKVRTPDEVIWLNDLLTERGHDCRLHIIIETNEGLEAAFDIAHCSSRVDALFFGGVDMAAELRCKNTWGSLLYARSRLVHAAASAGIDVIDVPYLDLDDLDGMNHDDCKTVAGTSTQDRQACPDTDGDGWSDSGDAFDNESAQWLDSDGDGFGDNPKPAALYDDCPTIPGSSTDDRQGCLDTDGENY